MSGKLAKMMRKEVRKRYRSDIDLFVKQIFQLPLGYRIHFCFDVIFKIGKNK